MPKEHTQSNTTCHMRQPLLTLTALWRSWGTLGGTYPADRGRPATDTPLCYAFLEQSVKHIR